MNAENFDPALMPYAERDVNGLHIALWRYLYNWRIQLSLESAPEDIIDEWCFRDYLAALKVMATWNGEGDPPGWFKNPTTGRYNRQDEKVKEQMTWDELEDWG